MTPPPGPPDPEDPDDATVRLVDSLVEDAARAAAANPGPPSAVARELSRMVRARCAARTEGGEGVVEAPVGVDDEWIDTARILAMDRGQLVATIARLRTARGEAAGSSDDDASEDQLRGVVRRLRPIGRA